MIAARSERTFVLASMSMVTSIAFCAQTAQAQPASSTVEKARALFVEGQRAYDEGRFDAAVQKLGEAYHLVQTPELEFNLARVYERMGEAANGIRFFKLYLNHGNPSGSERKAIERRIDALRGVERRQKEQIISAPPSKEELTAEARTFFLRGVSFFKKRQYEAALQAFIAAHRFSPAADLFFNLAVTSEKLARNEEAIDYYREYLRAKPASPDRATIEKKVETLKRRPR